jgi:hypothetical protein
MRKWRRICFILVLVLPFCLALSALAQEKKETEGLYTIKPGDTRGEISSEFVKEPFLLAKLWQRNPGNVDPHRIDTAEPVRLANGEDSMKEEAQKPVVEEERKETVTEPEVKKVEPPLVEKKPEEVGEVKAAEEQPKATEEKPQATEEKPQAQATEEKPKAAEEQPKATEEKPAVFPEVRSAGFFSDVDYRGIGIIVESKEGKTLMSEGDIAYLALTTSEPVLIGDKYTVFRASELLTHPATGKKIGRRYNIIGNIQIIDHYGRFYIAKVVEVFDGIYKGDLIRPYFKERMEFEQRKK